MKKFPRRFVFLALALCALPLVRLAAQDVTVGEPVWSLPEAAPEEMPKAKGKLRVEYPEDLTKAGTLGYAIVTRYVDATGKSLMLSAQGSHVLFQRAVEEEFGRGTWQMGAAKRGGQWVNAFIWMPVIFNPKSASLKGADATPRLLAVAPAITKERPAPSGTPQVVLMKLSLDATGAITQAVPEAKVKDSLLAAVQEALKAWRFAPARAGGQAVAAELTVPVICQRPGAPDLVTRVLPKAVEQARPVYPTAMRRYGITGEVLLSFDVDVDGKVLNPVIARSNNPAFDEPAIAALLKWRFQPGAADGKPVKTKMQVPIIFDLGGEGGPAFHIDGKTDQSKLPPELRYDTPVRIRGVMLPVYPHALRQAGVTGGAKAAMLIDVRGRVTAVKLRSADRPEFGLALTAALEGFTFDPALKDGKPVQYLLNFEQRFDAGELSDEAGEEMLALEKKHPERIVAASALDTPLKARSQRAPRFPAALDQPEAEGEALIEILVDKEGYTRLPRIVSATADAFGYAAVQSVATWQFEPPLAGGKPTVVRVRVPVKFSTKPATKPKAPGRAKPVDDEKPADAAN